MLDLIDAALDEWEAIRVSLELPEPVVPQLDLVLLSV